jgi:hypothetical protein
MTAYNLEPTGNSSELLYVGLLNRLCEFNGKLPKILSYNVYLIVWNL